MPNEPQLPSWGPLPVQRAGKGYSTHVEVNGVPLAITILPPANGDLAAHFAAAWQTFQVVFQRIELAVAIAAEALLDGKLPAWIEDDEDLEDLDVAAIRNCLSLDSLHFGADRHFTLWFRGEHPFSGELVRIEGNEEGQFLEAGM